MPVRFLGRCCAPAAVKLGLHNLLRRGAKLRPWAGAIAILLLASTWAAAAAPNQATSSRVAREDALRSIPLDRLSPDIREKVASTLAGTSLYRRLPIQVTPCDPNMYLFLVRHPEVVVNIWEVMNIANVAMTRTGPDTFRATDNAGTLCDVKFCYSDDETQVIYAEGAYSGPMFSKPIRARCVLLLKSGYLQETDGQYYITSRMDTFIQIEHAGVEVLAKTLQMLIHRSADYNFVETAAFLGTVSRTAEANPTGMRRLADKLANLEPNVRDEFAELSMKVGEKARNRQSTSVSQAPLSVVPVSSTQPLESSSTKR